MQAFLGRTTFVYIKEYFFGYIGALLTRPSRLMNCNWMCSGQRAGKTTPDRIGFEVDYGRTFAEIPGFWLSAVCRPLHWPMSKRAGVVRTAEEQLLWPREVHH